MRYLAFLVTIALTACASPQQSEQQAYRVAPPPIQLHVEQNGTFSAQAPIPHPSEIDGMRQSALHQLRAAAAHYGYGEYVISDMRIDDAGPLQLVLAGQFYRRGQGPADAMPVEGLNSGVVVVANAGQKSFQAQATLGQSDPLLAAEELLTTGSVEKPVVIEAPDLRIN